MIPLDLSLRRALVQLRHGLDLLGSECDCYAAGEALAALDRGDPAAARALLLEVRDAVASGECPCDDAALVHDLDALLVRLGRAGRIAA